ncbi:uncharacterized protein [Primulina huaijiensis]|uniref:uncharacterized protein n=1 Tax=Primulina huaijiensis TaxID=1492673 RepID=UPI003CC6EF09
MAAANAKAKYNRFVNELHHAIYTFGIFVLPTSYAEAVERAKATEDGLRRGGLLYAPPPQVSAHQPTLRPKVDPKEEVPLFLFIVAIVEEGHFSRVCPNRGMTSFQPQSGFRGGPSTMRPAVPSPYFQHLTAPRYRGLGSRTVQGPPQVRVYAMTEDQTKEVPGGVIAGSITTWEDMAKAFLLKYFPPSKTMKLRADITTFSEFEQESLYEARYKDLLRRCPHHELPLGLVVQTFYYGLISSNRTMIDAVACGNLLRKTAEEGYELLEEMAASSYHPQSERNTQRRNVRVHQVTGFSAVIAQLEALNRKIDSMNANGTAMRLQEIFCEKCGGEHYVKDCQDSGPFNVNEEAPGGQNSQNRPQGGQQYGKQPMYRSDPPREEKSNLEQMMSKFISATETILQNQDASIKGLENQIGQLAKMIASREPGTLPSNTETNPKEPVKAIELKSGKILESREKEKNQVPDEQTETSKGKSSNTTLAPTAQSKIVIPPPFPAVLKKAKLDAQFDILANKRKLEDHMTVNLTENCSALVQNKIPQKLKDLGSFSIPCMIGNFVFPKALCDLGANINLMPLSVFRKLGLGEPKPTRKSLQLADRSIKYPWGVIEDVLVKVDKFIFTADFVVLDMEEDMEMPLILGRPFLATGKALIDVQERKLRLIVGEEEITFDVFNALKHTLHSDSYRIDALVSNYVQDALRDPLEATFTTELR